MVSQPRVHSSVADPAAGLTQVGSDAVEPVQHPFQQDQVGMVASLDWPVDHDQVLVRHITDQDPDDAEGKVKPCGDLGDGQDLVAEGGDGPLLHGQLRGLLPGGGGGDQRLDLQVVVSGPVRPPVIAYGRTRRGSGPG